MRVPSTDGVSIELHDLGGSGPTLLLAHATGFCARAYQPLADLLGRRFHVWALDFRAHGDSTVPDSGDLAWTGMIADVQAAVDAIDDGPVYGYGHSMGGACLAGAELARPGTLRGAVFFEPIIVTREVEGYDGPVPLAVSARRRRPSFPSRVEALHRYAGRPPLGLFRADVLWSYVEHGLADDPDGGVSLKCLPENEAATFEAANKPRVDTMGGVDVPILVGCGADDGGGPAALAPLVADSLGQGELRRYEHITHFGPFQDPVTIAHDAIAFLLDR